MKAWAVVENGKPLREIDLPALVTEGSEVVVEVSHCGVCHTDLHIWEGHYDLGGGRRMSMLDRGVTLPAVLGHEIVGKVVAIGPDAEGVETGAIRILYPWIGCGHCSSCLAEEDNMCLEGRALGIIRHGGHADLVKVPHPRYLIDPGTVPLPVAATLACSGITAYSAVRKLLSLPAEEPVVIIGAGGLGLTAISALRALGRHFVVAADISDEKLATARDAGASHLVHVTDQSTAAMVEACGKQPRGIIDFVNSAQTAAAAFGALGKGGMLIQVGLMGGELSLPLPLMALRALTVQGSYVGTLKELRELVKLVEDGAIPAIPIQEMPKSAVNAALQRLQDGTVTGRIVLCENAAASMA